MDKESDHVAVTGLSDQSMQANDLQTRNMDGESEHVRLADSSDQILQANEMSVDIMEKELHHILLESSSHPSLHAKDLPTEIVNVVESHFEFKIDDIAPTIDHDDRQNSASLQEPSVSVSKEDQIYCKSSYTKSKSPKPGHVSTESVEIGFCDEQLQPVNAATDGTADTHLTCTLKEESKCSLTGKNGLSLCGNMLQCKERDEDCSQQRLYGSYRSFRIKPCYVKLQRLDEEGTNPLHMKLGTNSCGSGKVAHVYKGSDSIKQPEDDEVTGNNIIEKSNSVCSLCGKECTYPSWLKKHLETSHNEQKHKCLICGKGFPGDKSLKNHETGHNPSQCSICGTFVNPRHLKEHMKLHATRNPFKCEECGKCFRSKGGFKMHQMRHTGQRPEKCSLCDKCFGLPHQLRAHMRRVHSGVKRYQCPQCDKCSATIGGFRYHIRTHTGEKPYRCDQCGKSFSSASYLNVHKRVHTGEKPFKCPLCTKAFRQSSHLTTHVMTHTGETPYKCSICGQGFGQSCHLNTHMTIHTGEKRHKCSYCGMRFAHKSTWQIHEREHTGETPCQCKECGQSFKNPSSLRIHIKLHKGEKRYKCPDCDKAFVVLGTLQQHQMAKHSTVRPHACTICGKAFIMNYRLCLHMRKHGVFSPYACEHCGMQFKKAHDLRVHIRTGSCEKLND